MNDATEEKIKTLMLLLGPSVEALNVDIQLAPEYYTQEIRDAVAEAVPLLREIALQLAINAARRKTGN